MQNYKNINDYFISSTLTILHYCIKKNNLNALNYLINKVKNKKEMHFNLTDCAIKFNNLNYAFLLEHFYKIYPTHYGMKTAMQNKNLKSVIWIYNINKKYPIHNIFEGIIDNAISSDSFDIFYYVIKNDNSKLSPISDYALSLALNLNNYDIVIYILQQYNCHLFKLFSSNYLTIYRNIIKKTFPSKYKKMDIKKCDS